MKGKIAWIKFRDRWVDDEDRDKDFLEFEPGEEEITFIEPESYEKECYQKIVYFPLEDD